MALDAGEAVSLRLAPCHGCRSPLRFSLIGGEITLAIIPSSPLSPLKKRSGDLHAKN